MKFKSIILTFLVTLPVIICDPAYSQRAGSAARFYQMAVEIDSLQNAAADLTQKAHRADSLYKAEKFVSAELRDQVLKMEQQQKSLEASKTDVEDENLKLNQSNRILIIFNSVVAVLLVITLVFVLKRAGRKMAPPVGNTASKPAFSSNSNPDPNKLASFEDKLAQLEKLGGLKEKGILSDDEFQQEKQRILGK
jgi:hypothetical protein